MVQRRKGKSGILDLPTMNERKTMITWFRENLLAIIVIIISGIGTYTLAVNRIAILETQVIEIKSVNQQVLTEVKYLQNKSSEIELISSERNIRLTKSLEAQQERSTRNDKVIENNTTALNKIAVIFAKVNTKLENYDRRLNHLEGRNE